MGQSSSIQSLPALRESQTDGGRSKPSEASEGLHPPPLQTSRQTVSLEDSDAQQGRQGPEGSLYPDDTENRRAGTPSKPPDSFTGVLTSARMFWGKPNAPTSDQKITFTSPIILALLAGAWMTGLICVTLYFNFSTMAANAVDALRPAFLPEYNDTLAGYLTQQQLRERAREFSKDGFIILLVCNFGFSDFFTNWALHAREFGYDKHFIAIAEDEGSYQYVNEHWPGHAVRLHVDDIERAQADALSTAGLKSGEEKSKKGSASAMDTPEFLLIMYRRLFYLRSLMNAGLDVLLCDVDIAFIRDPMLYITGGHDLYGVVEIQDKYYHNVVDTVPLASNSSFYLCGGFLYFKSNAKGYLILDHLLNKVFRAKRGKKIDNDQTFLRFVLLNMQDLEHKPSVGAIPQQRFPPGWLFFGNAEWRKKNFGQVVMIHNNWIRSKQCKMIRWMQYGFWKVPGDDGKIPTIEWSIQKDDGTIIGVRDRDWTVHGISKEHLPWNATECRVGGGIVHPDELKRRD